MRRILSILLFLVAYCTPVILITVPVLIIARAVCIFKEKKKKCLPDLGKAELPPLQRNTHYGVDL